MSVPPAAPGPARDGFCHSTVTRRPGWEGASVLSLCRESDLPAPGERIIHPKIRGGGALAGRGQSPLDHSGFRRSGKVAAQEDSGVRGSAQHLLLSLRKVHLTGLRLRCALHLHPHPHPIPYLPQEDRASHPEVTGSAQDCLGFISSLLPTLPPGTLLPLHPYPLPCLGVGGTRETPLSVLATFQDPADA